jgi:glycosyltransferase involved in cell wall biosynthesis
MLQTAHELVSVVIPTRNRRDRLERAIKSAEIQTWPNIEIIVVDDASSDGTQSFLQQLVSADARVQVVRNEVPRGGGAARNQGVATARGPYVAFLDDDDIWLPEKLAEQVALMRANPEASAVSCGFIVQHSSLIHRKVSVVHPLDEQQILRSNQLGGASMCLTTKENLVTVQGFDPILCSGQDWDLWIKLHGIGDVLICDKPLVCYVPHQGPRITRNLKSTYEGRKKIYFRYKLRMSETTRKTVLCELIYCRKVLLSCGQSSRFLGLLQVLHFASWTTMFRYVYRYLKFTLMDDSPMLSK